MNNEFFLPWNGTWHWQCSNWKQYSKIIQKWINIHLLTEPVKHNIFKEILIKYGH